MDDEEEEEERKEEIEEESCKIVLIGESGVGKTSIITQFTKGVFSSDIMTTNGATFSTKKIDFSETKNKKLSFEIWDTAGQEKYRSLAKMFFKDAIATILVYDITNKKSFEELQNYWFDQVKNNGPKKVILSIVGNKSDLIIEERVKEEEARNFAESKGALFHYTSAKNACGINELFKDIGLKYLEPDFNSTEEIKERKERKAKSNMVKKEEIIKPKKRRCC